MKQTQLVTVKQDYKALHDQIAALEAKGFELRSSQETYLTFARDVVRMDDQSILIQKLQRKINRLESENKNLMGASYLEEVLELRAKLEAIETAKHRYHKV